MRVPATWPPGVIASQSMSRRVAGSPALSVTSGGWISVTHRRPEAVSQRRTSPSQPPAAAILPSSEIAAAYCHSLACNCLTGAPVIPFQTRTVLSLPDGDQPAAVAAEGKLMHRARVTTLTCLRLVGVQAPPANLRLAAGGDEAFAIGMDRHGKHFFIVFAVGALFLERAGVQSLDRPVLGAGQKRAAVGRIRERVDEVGVPSKNSRGAALAQVPQPDRLIEGGRGEL